MSSPQSKKKSVRSATPINKLRARQGQEGDLQSNAYLDDYVNFISFGRRILIVCPHCQKCAIIGEIVVHVTSMSELNRIAKASCWQCHKRSLFPYPSNPGQSVPFWLVTRVLGKLLWVHNEQHLAWLKETLQSDDREDGTGVGPITGLRAILPQWITAKENHDQVVRGIKRLRTRMETTVPRSLLLPF
jgi:hypothetical protein